MTKRKSDGEKKAEQIFGKAIEYEGGGIGIRGGWFTIKEILPSCKLIKAHIDGLNFFINARNKIFVYDELYSLSVFEKVE